MPKRPAVDKSQTRFDLIRKRLLWAKKIWVGKGLIGRASGTNTMRQLVEFYRSNQWQDRGAFGMEFGPDVLRVVNKVFPIANRQQAGVAARNPRVQYFPRREDDRANAPFIEALHNYDIREDDHILELNSALRYAQFAPFPGVVRHGYTPEREIYDEEGKLISFQPRAHPTRPWIEAVAPWNVLVDPRAQSFAHHGGAMWCAFRSVMTVDQIRRNPNMVRRKSLDALKGNITGPWQEMLPAELLAKEDPDAGGYVEVWSYYDLEDKTWCQLTLDGVDDWLREPADWPIPWERLPIDTLIVHPQIDTPFPKSLLEGLLPYQRELNEIRTMLSWLARQTRRIGLYDQGKIDDAKATLLQDMGLFEWLGVNGNPNDAIFHGQVGGLPQELLTYAAAVVDDMREEVGLSLFARARRENVESATEAQAIVQGQDVIESRTQDAFDRFVQDAEATYMQGRKAVLEVTGTTEALRIVGPEGTAALEAFHTIDADQIAGEFEFEIVAGSTRPRDKDREAQKAALDTQFGAAFPFVKADFLVRRYFELRGIDPARAMEQESAMASSVQRGQAMMQPPEGGAPAQGGTLLDPNTLALLAQAGGNGTAQ